MKSIQLELDLYNSDHIKEPTAYEAFSHKKEREHLCSYSRLRRRYERQSQVRRREK